MTTAFINGVRVLSTREFIRSLWKSERDKLIIQCAVIMEETKLQQGTDTTGASHLIDSNSNSNDKPYSLCLQKADRRYQRCPPFDVVVFC